MDRGPLMSDEPLLAGVDVGSTGVKAGVYDTAGRVMAFASEPTPVRAAGAGRAEHDADALWAAAVAALHAAVDNLAAPARIAGVAVASMAEAGVALDAHGAPTHPVIAWFDDRSADQAHRLAAAVGEQRMRAVTGLRPQPIYGLCKLAWLAAHAPTAFARTRRWLNVADYVAYRLSGQQATDLSLASRMWALDLRARDWFADALDAAGIPASLLAPLVTAGTALGRVTPEAARATGLPTTAVVGAGGHDHVCGALAAGVVEPGRALDSMGTAESLLLPLHAPLAVGDSAVPYSQGVHVAADRWYAAAGVHAGGASVQWALRVLEGDRDGLLARAAEVPAGAHGVLFDPHLHLPGVVDAGRGALVGLRPDTDGAVLLRAVLEGLAATAHDALTRLTSDAQPPAPPQVRVIGGGARNRLLLSIKAAVGGRSLHRLGLTEATSLGAALLGGVGAGVFADAATAADTVVPDLDEVVPDPRDVVAYAEPLRRMQALRAVAGRCRGRDQR